MRFDPTCLTNLSDLVEELLADQRHCEKELKVQETRRSERHILTRRQLNSVAGLGISAQSSLTPDHVEGSEAGHLNVVPLNQALLHAFQNQLHEFHGFLIGNSTMPLINDLCQVCFDHGRSNSDGPFSTIITAAENVSR